MRTNRLPLIVAGVVGLILVLVLRTAFGGDKSEEAASNAGDGKPRAGCIALTVAASTEKSALLSEIAKDYARENRTAAGKCVDVKVVGKASGAAEEALARDWNENVDGPRPDVWSPAASTWLALLREDRTRGDKQPLLAQKNPSVANTPLVLAMPQPMAQSLGWPKTPVGWADVLKLGRDPAGWGSKGHPEWGRFRLGKTNPLRSTSGLAATVGTFVAATGRSSDLTAADLVKPPIRAFATAVESSVVHYGDTTLNFLANLQRADDAGQGLTYVSAVAVEEKSVIDYNEGNPTGDPATRGKHPKPKVPLVAVYPKEGTLLSDNPYAVLAAPWVDADKRAAAEDFRAYLLTGAAQARFTEAGFRDAAGKAGQALRGSKAVLLDQPKAVLGPPAPDVLAKVRKTWTEVRKRARVLLVLDVSGSMSQVVGGAGGKSKLDLAKAAAAGALSDFAPDDEVGLWVFTSDLPGDKVYRELAPVAPLQPQLAAIRKSLGALVPLNATPLYAVTRQAHTTMSAKIAPDRINAVVLLTDGRNEFSQDTDLDGLLRQLANTEGAQTGLRVFSIGYGENADMETLRKISEASQAAAYDATDPTTIERIFTAVISNF